SRHSGPSGHEAKVCPFWLSDSDRLLTLTERSGLVSRKPEGKFPYHLPKRSVDADKTAISGITHGGSHGSWRGGCAAVRERSLRGYPAVRFHGHERGDDPVSDRHRRDA